MLRRLTVLLLIALALPALALGSHKDPKKQINAADQRKAASILLKRTDFVAGWKKVPSATDDDSHFNCPGYDPNGSDLVLRGEAEADFERTGGFPSVYSYADVYKTKANALAAWTRTVKPAAAKCIATLLKQGIEAEGGKVAITAAGKISFPKLAPRTAAFRATLKVTVTENGETNTVSLTLYMVALGGGRGEAGVMAIGFGGTVPLADVRTLARVTAKRFAAAKL
ncbi:MAG: hypothetical protein ACRDNB_09915 [Gaiellaceae bacterium]